MAGASAPAASKAAGFDVIVVDAGIMGSCMAHAAASRGSRVLLLKHFDLLHPLGSSHGDSRIIRHAYAQPRYFRMVRLVRRLWADAEAESGYRVLTPTPHLSMGPCASASLAAALANTGAEEILADDLGSRWGGAFAFTVPDPSDARITALSDHGGVPFQAASSDASAAARELMAGSNTGSADGEEPSARSSSLGTPTMARTPDPAVASADSRHGSAS